MQLTFLEADTRLTKTYARDKLGNVTKSPYPNARYFTSHTEHPKTLADFEKALVAHAALGHCLLKGNVARPLVQESRAGSTDRLADTDWVCIDIDGLPATAFGSVDALVDALGFKDISYVLQWSGSQDIDAKAHTEWRCHIFIQLDKPAPAPTLKQWLIQNNHQLAEFKNSLALTSTGHALRYPLDVTTCQSDKLIYIATPTFVGMRDPLSGPGSKPRVSLVRRKKDKGTLPTQLNTVAQNKVLNDAAIANLRAAAGLPKHRGATKMSGSVEVLSKPDSSTVTDMRIDRGFVYFNLNGGDSWAYYHPENNPDYIYNFKGEPTYLTKELLPDYWASLQKTSARTDSSSGITYLAFLDKKTSTYYRGTYDAKNDILDINAAKNETMLRHFCAQHGVVLGDFVPEWEVRFEPHAKERVDFKTQTINLFERTDYMKAWDAAMAAKKPLPVPKSCPPTIHRIIDHALGNDPKVTAHFMNWFACIVQQKRRTLTAWVLHGTQGTGKGIMMERILRPILGRTQTAARRMEEFNERYNGFMRNCLLVLVDEVQTKTLMNEKGVMANLKGYITEGSVAVRAMYQMATEYPNFTNWIFASNMPDPIIIDKADRRFNVARYQPKMLGMTDKELACIEPELEAFYCWLMAYKVDLKAVATVMITEDRAQMISIGKTSMDEVADAVLDGNMEFFLDQLPSNRTKILGDVRAQNRLDDYKKVLENIMVHADKKGAVTIPRDDLRVMFEYCVGKAAESPNKFTAQLKHHRIHISKQWDNTINKSVNGIKAVFKDFQQFPKYKKEYFPPETPKVPAKASQPKPSSPRKSSAQKNSKTT